METTPVPASEVAQDDLIQDTISGMHKACDIVLGTAALALGLLSAWFLAQGEVRPLTVVAAWSLLLFNGIWSVVTRRRDRATSDLIRAAICLPIAAFLYVAEDGVFARQVIPAVLMVVGIGISIGISSRSTLPAYIGTFAYAGTVFGVAALELGRVDIAALDDALGIALTGCVVTLVAGKLRGTLDEARRQRNGAREQKDRAEAALDSLHAEMAHRMRVEVELRQAQKLESVGRLAAGVAHEINTPVQFASDSIQFVRDGVTELFGVIEKLAIVQRSVLDGAPSREAAGVAAEAVDTTDVPYLLEHVPGALDLALEGLGRVATIVRSMKEFAYPDSKDMEFADLNRAIECTLTMARNEYRSVAELETDLGELPLVRCHVGELNQAVLNIVINAAHAIDDAVRGTSARGCIRVRTHRDGDDVVIAISDTGTGIPEHARNRIFDPFFTTKQVGRGTGQGLAIARSVIVDKHHGRLGFETELGKGTTFTIRLAIDGGQQACAAAA